MQIVFWPQKGGRTIQTGGAAPLYGLGVGLAASLSGQGAGGFGAAAFGRLGAPLYRAAAAAAALGLALCTTAAVILAVGPLAAPPVAPLPPFSIGYVNVAALALATPAWALTAPIGAALGLRIEPFPIRLASRR